MDKTVLHKGRCTNRWKGSRVAEQAPLVKATQAVRALYKWQTIE